MTDPVDEWAAQGLREFQGKPLVSAMHADLKLQETDEEKKEKEQRAEGLKAAHRRDEGGAQGARARGARVGPPHRLAVCLVVPEGGSPAYLERLLASAARAMPRAKRILEVNPTHPVIEHLRALHEQRRRTSAQVARVDRAAPRPGAAHRGQPAEDPEPLRPADDGAADAGGHERRACGGQWHPGGAGADARCRRGARAVHLSLRSAHHRAG